MLKIAAIQMCSSNSVKDNLLMAEKLINEAASRGAQLIVLPEMFATLGLKEKSDDGSIQLFLSEQAKRHHCWILGGTIPIACDQGKKVRAASLLFDEKGKLVARYDKMHLFDATLSPEEFYRESDTIEPGNEFVVVDTPVGKLGLGVCYDIRFPEMFRYLFNKGAEIIALPAAFTVKTGQAHWEVLARSRAIENFCYFIGAAQGGTHANGRKTYGNSLIVDPWGTVIAKKDGVASGVIDAEINLERLREIRNSIPVSQHQKMDFDLRDK
jgi:predicted amidohydrolase